MLVHLKKHRQCALVVKSDQELERNNAGAPARHSYAAPCTLTIVKTNPSGLRLVRDWRSSLLAFGGRGQRYPVRWKPPEYAPVRLAPLRGVHLQQAFNARAFGFLHGYEISPKGGL
jgi:hypothetical protein